MQIKIRGIRKGFSKCVDEDKKMSERFCKYGDKDKKNERISKCVDIDKNMRERFRRYADKDFEMRERRI